MTKAIDYLNLADALIEDILSASDEEILKEALEQGDDLQKLGRQKDLFMQHCTMKSCADLFTQMMQEMALNTMQYSCNFMQAFDPRIMLSELIRTNPSSALKLTLQKNVMHLNEMDLSEEDVTEMLGDFEGLCAAR